ncbi:Bifunctional nuclease 1 [Camellia lanceoleosa]|uniref:Bifunctional nuclease 1 n=1 Tax=Camellia lanceoleosa TaxID=1840588 RepID=A0ACC0IK72_9ERIC|nr:Bifunctional nuclease 1 [Camellia lanceoleosa]
MIADAESRSMSFNHDIVGRAFPYYYNWSRVYEKTFLHWFRPKPQLTIAELEMIKMRDGRYLRCVHNNPHSGHLPNYAPRPTIVLKMKDGTGLFLHIIVLEIPSVLLMAAICNVQIAGPTMYQIVKKMIDKIVYEVKLVQVTKRVHEAYFAQLYLTKLGSIDGTNILPRDNAVYRALLYSQAGLYDPFADPKLIGDPYCTIFVSHLSHLTTEQTILNTVSKYIKVKNLRLVRHIRSKG